MASGFDDTMELEILNRYLKNTTGVTPVATNYAALATGTSSDSAFTEVTNANAYQRTALAFGTAAAGSISTNAACTFPQCTTSSWGTITSMGIYTSQTYGAGSKLFWGDLSASVTINVNDTFEFASGQVTVSVN